MELHLRLFLLFLGLPAVAIAQPLHEIYLQNKSLTTPVGEPATSIFLTFDDGPTAAVTLPIAQVLADYEALGTFFVVGNKTISDINRLILSQLVAEGHLIGNHTWAHRNTYRSEAAFEQSLLRTSTAIGDFLPASKLIFFRTPGGVWNRSRARWVNLTRTGAPDPDFAWYVGPIFWNAGGSLQGPRGNRRNAADWECWSKGVSIRECADGYLAKIRANYTEGKPSVVLMHDLRVQTRELLIYVLEGLARDDVNWQFKRLDMARWPFARPSL